MSWVQTYYIYIIYHIYIIWDGWMAPPTQRTWVWTSSGRGWRQGSLACCSPWGCKESDTTEQLKWYYITSKNVFFFFWSIYPNTSSKKWWVRVRFERWEDVNYVKRAMKEIPGRESNTRERLKVSDSTHRTNGSTGQNENKPTDRDSLLSHVKDWDLHS